MHRLLALCLGCLVILCACESKDAAAVREVYDQYNAALRDKNGDAFLQTIDPANVEHYGQFVAAAKTGTKEQVAALSPIGRGYVLLLRHRLKAAELKDLDGAGFVRLCVQRGWFFMEDEEEHFSLGPVRIKTPRASAELRINGERTTDRLEFVQVEDRWLVNDEALDRAWEKAAAKAARRLGVSVDQLLMEREEEESGQPVEPAILDQPPTLQEASPQAPAVPKKKPKKT